MAAPSATVHASAVLLGSRAVLIRGPAGAGKSRLALNLIEAAPTTSVRFARLVGDDRVRLQAAGGRLLVRPAPVLAGLIELRGVGILRVPHEPAAVVGLVVDLGLDAPRLPSAAERATELEGISVPRLAVAAPENALSSVLALLTSRPGLLSGPDEAT